MNPSKTFWKSTAGTSLVGFLLRVFFISAPWDHGHHGNEMWLNWSKPARLAFIMGNLRGYSDGVAAGCGDAMRTVRSLPSVKGFTDEAAQDMRMDCRIKYKPSNRTFESYEGVITNFYTHYPEDRLIEIQDVLQLLASDPNLTAKDIHKNIKVTHMNER